MPWGKIGSTSILARRIEHKDQQWTLGKLAQQVLIGSEISGYSLIVNVFHPMKQNNTGGTASNELMIAAGERWILTKRQNCMRQVRREKAQAERRARRIKVTPIKRGFG